MQKLGVVLAIALSCSLSLSAVGQQKATSKKNATAKAVQAPGSEDIPPEVERLEDAKITPVQPIINFDTAAPPNDAFTKDILALLVLTGALENEIQVADKMLKESLGESDDPRTAVFYERFMQEMREGKARRWLNNLYVRTYREHFTHNEIKEITQFYQTPLGKKFIEKSPLVVQAVMLEAQKMGAYLGQSIMTDILNKQ